MNTTHDYVGRLRKLDACVVSDALDKLGLIGAVSGLPQRSSRRRIAGRAVTVKLVCANEVSPTTTPPRHLGTTAIEMAGSDEVIVVEQRTGIEAGSWGGILSLAAKLRGIAGVVADGPVRDIDEARQYDLPVFCSALTARTARGRVAEAGTNVSVTIRDHVVEPGDYLIADNSAVVFIAAACIERVLAAAEQIAMREAAMAMALQSGKTVTEVMGASYENMLHPPRSSDATP